MAILVVAFYVEDPVESAVHRPVAQMLGLHMFAGGMMGPVPYGVLMIVRLAWNVLLVAVICTALKRPFAAPPIIGPRVGRLVSIGLATGLVVMIAAICAILATGAATAAASIQSPASAILNGAAWMAFDFLGATGEELFGRVAILLVAERFVGWRGAILVSGLMFSVIHIGNPGTSAVWLVRLFLQGALLAYAVYRTRSLWWSVGYHTGWNWASAPLFGAAGSGYLDRGHLLDFTPRGPAWITGGGVGPEGGVFAFVAVVVAFGLLLAVTRNTPVPEKRFPNLHLAPGNIGNHT